MASRLTAKFVQVTTQKMRGWLDFSPLLRQTSWLQHPMLSRFFYAWNILNSHAWLERVLLSDVRDVLFQADPFQGIEDGLHYGELSTLIKDEPLDTSWMHVLTDDGNLLRRVKDRRIGCAGVIGGGRAVMEVYLTVFLEFFAQKAHRVGAMACVDQAIHNVALLDGRLSEVARPEPLGSSLIMTVCNEWSEHWVLDDSRGVMSKSGELAAVVHQYDRKHRLVDHFEARLGLSLPRNFFIS